MAYHYIIQGTNIVLVVDGEQFTVNPSHIHYEAIRSAIKTNDWEAVNRYINPVRSVLEFGAGNIEIQGQRLFWQGRELDNSLVNKIVSMLQEGFDVSPLTAFMDRLMQNPSATSVNELYLFLETGVMPITPDGYFLAFKRVNEDYTDVHSSSVLNKPAALMTEEDLAALTAKSGKRAEVTVAMVDGVTTVSMPRNAVDDLRNRTCSYGLHFCSREYLNSFPGSRIVVLKIDPADVVSIPSDYNNAKGRTWRYQVIGEVNANPDSALRAAVQVGA